VLGGGGVGVGVGVGVGTCVVQDAGRDFCTKKVNVL